MAKDPAFLFYPGDWLGGTMLLTRQQKGCYIDLLMAQFNTGPLSMEHINTVLGADQNVWLILKNKFKKNDEGNFFNEKLASEVEKRKNYVSSRRKNKLGSKQSYDKTHEQSHDKTSDAHMSKHMENENENVIIKDSEEGTGEEKGMPLAHSMQQRWLARLGKKYPSRPMKDFPAILEIGLFLHQQEGGNKNHLSDLVSPETILVLEHWDKWIDWYEQNGNGKDLSYLAQFKMQQIFIDIHNSTNGQLKNSGQSFANSSKDRNSAYASGF